MFSFQYIEYLLALAAVPLFIFLFFFVLNWKRKTVRKIGDEKLVKEMTKNFSSHHFSLKFILIVIAFSAVVFALANLRSPQGSEKVTRNGIDVMIALDVSKSMLAQDVKPSRLERAKQILGKLIDKLSNDRVGIVVFAGRAYLQMPLTSDHGAAKMFLSTASPDVVPTQGTVIGDALQMCQSSFNAKEKKYKAVVLISDGEDHDEGAIKTAEQMASEGIVIHTIGIGSPQGATIMDETTHELKKDNEGVTVITKLNEEELRRIATKANGIYQLFSNTDNVVSKLDAQLGSMDQRMVTEDDLINYKNYFPYFLLAALIFLILELFISEKKIIVNTTPTKAIKILTLIFILPASIFAQSEKEIIKKGNEAYAKKDYATAINHYKKAAEKNPVDAIACYNLGNALYKNNKADDAVNAYSSAVNNATSTDEKGKSFYNKGVVLQNNKKLPECIDAYKNALKLNPDDEDARQNLQKALQQQKQQQQKNKDQQKQNKEKQKQKNEPPKPQPPKISKQDAEEKLKALAQEEKNLQDKLKKVNPPSANKPEKDW